MAANHFTADASVCLPVGYRLVLRESCSILCVLEYMHPCADRPSIIVFAESAK